ncbi:MAG: toxic anion resistance protein [Lachnospiraceae bacterium]|nr:toxic anion resistance protein [Lachnospiraceae bacterium]MBR5765615.1 toxic anion resistance protein [Lachnospiraceae bacterium]MBR6485293.1 toxic anion resistance protein [Lachnospiraceae bacterium]
MEGTAAVAAEAVPEATLYESPFAPLEEEKPAPAHTPVDYGTELADIKTKSELTPEEQKVVDSYVSQIDLNNSQLVIQYGAGAQKKIADFSEGALNSVRTKDMGEIGEMLTGLVGELKGFNNDDEKKGLFGLFKKGQERANALLARYDKAEANVNKVVKVMEGHQVTLLKDVAMLDKMYETNLTYYKNLTLYILAGKEKLAIAKQEELPKLLKKAEESGLPEDSQAASDYASMIERFEKKIYDLELTRNISMQMAPQIRLIQNNDTMMSEKIQSTLVNTIPLWKSQMVIAIGLNHSTEAAKAQKEVTDVTNEMLKKNAEALKVATIASAKESERGIVDIETLTHTNQTLIDTLNEVVQIQADGRSKRAEAEKELSRIETEMHTKLIELSRASGQQ